MASKVEAEMKRQQPFRFLDLPRELRDLVYHFLTVDHDDLTKQEQAPRGHMTHSIAILANLKSGPSASLLRVQRQFATEYTETVLRDSILVLADDYASPMDLRELPPNMRDYVNKAKCILLAVCFVGDHSQIDNDEGNACALEEHIHDHSLWIDRTQSSLGHPCLLSMVLYLAGLVRVDGWPQKVSGHDLSEAVAELIGVTHTSEINVYCATDIANKHWTTPAYGLSATKYGTWTKGHGWRRGTNVGRAEDQAEE